MAIYRKGQVSLDAQGYLTGYNTKWKASLTLIRPGATIIIASNPVIYGVVSEVISDTSIRLINFGKATAAKSDYVILLHDSLTVDGLAQDVAETLRYYQGKETEFAHFIEVIKGLDYEKLEALIQRIKHESEEFEKNLAEIDKRVEQTKTYANQAQQSAHDAAARKDEVSILHTQTEDLKNQAAQQATAAAQQVALAKEEVRLAKAEVQKAEGEVVKANKEFIKAKAEATLAQEIVAGAKLEVVNEAKVEVERARNEADRAQGVVDNAKQEIREEVQVQVDNATEQAGRAKSEADRAAQLADQMDTTKVMLKDKNLSDVSDLNAARKNMKVDRLLQDDNMTRVKTADGKAELRIGFDDWYVYRDSQDSEAGFIALPVKGGGTGGTTPLEAREGLELDRFRQHAKRTEMATANGEYRLFVGDDGDWGALNKQSDHVALPVRAGGTGAKDAATARKNLNLDRVVQDANMTRIKSQDSKTELRIGQSDWYVFRDSQDSERGYIALPVQGGGTGANDAAGARRNLQVDRFNQDSTTETRVLSADGAQAIITPNDSTWGLYRFGSGWIPLGVGQGGTGAKDAAGARANIESFHQKRTALGAGDNLNSLFGFNKTGYYYNPMNANATAANNYPEAFAGVLLVTSSLANGSEQTMQKYFPYDKPEIFYVRHYNKSGSSWVWSGWVKHISAFRYGVGATDSLHNNVTSAACQFISDNNANTSWAPSNGAGFQASYAASRIFQFWIGTSDNAYIRYVDTTNPKESKTSKEWKKLAVIESAPVFTGGSVGASGSDKTARIGCGGSDVYLTNSKSNKYLQLKDDGSLQYDSKYVMHRLMKYEADYEVSVYNFRVVTKGNGFQIKGNANNNNQAIYYSGINGDGTRAYWIGNGSNDRVTTMYSDAGSNSYSLLPDGTCRINTKGGNQQVDVMGGSVVVRRPNGKYLRVGCDGNNTQQGSLRIWGNASDRPDVLEFGFESGWVFYAQRNTDNSRLFNVNGRINCVSLTQSSDRDLKENIEVIQDATAALRKMNGYTYTMKDDGMPYAGVIAQEVQEALPEAISGFSKYVDIPGVNKDGSQLQGEERYLGVDYSAVTGLLVQVCRESDDRITKLEQENEALKSELESLKSGLESLKSAVASLQSVVSQ